MEALADTVKTGFADTRHMIEESVRRQEQRTSDIHTRIDSAESNAATRSSELQKQLADQAKESLKAREANWPLTISAAGFAFLMGSALVSFVLLLNGAMREHFETRVNYNANAIDKQDLVLQRELRMLDDVSAERHNRQDDRLRDLHLEIEKLHRITDLSIDREMVDAREAGYIQARVEALERALDVKTSDRFFGREGAAMDARLQALERFVREHPPCPPESK
jgi:hypothetical protein